MGLCIGGAWCRKQKCKNRCKGWFANMPMVEEGCKKACNDNTSFSRDDYLCSGNYINVGEVMLRYKTDPCPNDGITMQQLLDPLDTHNAESRRLKQYLPVLAGAAILFVVVLLIIPTKNK